MPIQFYKYHGAGNDFILLDNRKKDIILTKEQIAFLCDRHLGIGADGLMLLEEESGFDFRMVYYNSDGNESTMCGNGGRCITAFAQRLNMIEGNASFVAIDGAHKACVNPDSTVSLEMIDVNEIQFHDDHCILNTGSPHYIQWVKDIDNTDVFYTGRSIRNRAEFQPGGINVNFVQRLADAIRVRTYERGVEAETLSCGTGVTAAAIAFTEKAIGIFSVRVETPGGMLSVNFEKQTSGTAKHIVLIGPATFVFQGEISL